MSTSQLLIWFDIYPCSPDICSVRDSEYFRGQASNSSGENTGTMMIYLMEVGIMTEIPRVSIFRGLEVETTILIEMGLKLVRLQDKLYETISFYLCSPCYLLRGKEYFSCQGFKFLRSDIGSWWSIWWDSESWLIYQERGRENWNDQRWNYDTGLKEVRSHTWANW